MQDRTIPPRETNGLAQPSTIDQQNRKNRSDTQAPVIDEVMDECRRTRETGFNLGDRTQISGCAPDGTLVQYRFVDGGDRPLVVETINFRDNTHTFMLKNQDIKLVVNNYGRILSYSNGDHLYSFDPKKQTYQDFDHALPAIDLTGTSSATKPQPKKWDSGDGLTLHESKNDGTVTYRLPDGLKVSFDKYSSLSGIEKENGFKYELDLLHTTKVDPNLPKDHRLHDPVAIKDDMQAAVVLGVERSKGLPGVMYDPIAHLESRSFFINHMLEMPEDKRDDYARVLQMELDKDQKDKRFTDRMRFDFTVDKAGNLKTFDFIWGSYLPYFSIPIERIPLWGK